VLRLTATGLKITAMRQINNATQLEVILTANHNFVAGDYFTILNSQYTQLNGVYKVYSTPSSTSLIFDYKNSNRISATVSLTDQSTINTYGNIYKWVSVRIASMDNVNDRIPYNVYRDVDTTNFVNGDRIFADNVTGKWTIYEKTNPYETKLLSSPDTSEQQEFGYQVVARNDGKTLAV
jgi:hypothetical protein